MLSCGLKYIPNYSHEVNVLELEPNVHALLNYNCPSRESSLPEDFKRLISMETKKLLITNKQVQLLYLLFTSIIIMLITLVGKYDVYL
jgi:hypothetical protein